MGGKRLKPEPPSVRGTCVTECCSNPQQHKGNGLYRAHCAQCHRERYGLPRSGNRRKYRKYMKDICERCGFVPEHRCQLDVDHINGDHSDNREENLQTLCANCHRLKTYLNKDWET